MLQDVKVELLFCKGVQENPPYHRKVQDPLSTASELHLWVSTATEAVEYFDTICHPSIALM